MSLYREVGRSRRAIAIGAGVALLLGLVVGFALGRGTAPEPTLAEQIEELRAEVRPALAALELITVEYPQAVEGEQVVAETEYQAALAQAQRAVDTFARVADDYALIDGARAEVVAAKLAAVRLAIEAKQKPRMVAAGVEEARGMLNELVGGSGQG